MIPALRWAAMRAILMFQWEVMDKVTRQCPQTTTFFEEKGEPKRYRTEILPLTSLTARPNRLSQNLYNNCPFINPVLPRASVLCRFRVQGLSRPNGASLGFIVVFYWRWPQRVCQYLCISPSVLFSQLSSIVSSTFQRTQFIAFSPAVFISANST